MEISAAAGSAATVVQLVDFAGKLLIATTSFFAAVTEASKELQALHERTQHLEKLFENTRALACSYQNSKLAITPQNQITLELLGQALTACSIDLQSLNNVLQKPLEQTEWRIVRFKRRVRHVFDEGTLRRLSLRLEGDISLINGLLSGINMHNGSVIHGSIERVADLIESLLQVSVELATISSRQQGAKSPVENVEKIVERLNQADKERAKNQQVTYSEPDDFTIDLLGRHKALEIAAIRTDDLMPSLELFLPAFRTRLQFVHKDSGEQFLSKEAAHWLSSEFYGLISDVYTAAERSHAHFLTEEQNPDTNFKALMPRRFHRLTNLPNSSAKDDGDKQLSAPREVADSVSCIQAEHADILRYDCKLKIPSGRLCSYFESTHWSKAGPVFDSQSGRVSIAFVPKFELGIPGIGVSFMKQHGYLQPSQQSFLSIFNILPGNAPIIREVKDGDCGVSRVLQKLKAGESWAGDRDENGRSLLSYAVESGSRDMCALLFRMGAHPQDVHSMLQLQLHIPMWSARPDDQ